MTGAGGRCCVAVVLRFRRINRVIAESLSQLLRARLRAAVGGNSGIVIYTSPSSSATRRRQIHRRSFCVTCPNKTGINVGGDRESMGAAPEIVSR